MSTTPIFFQQNVGVFLVVHRSQSHCCWARKRKDRVFTTLVEPFGAHAEACWSATGRRVIPMRSLTSMSVGCLL